MAASTVVAAYLNDRFPTVPSERKLVKVVKVSHPETENIHAQRHCKIKHPLATRQVFGGPDRVAWNVPFDATRQICVAPDRVARNVPFDAACDTFSFENMDPLEDLMHSKADNGGVGAMLADKLRQQCVVEHFVLGWGWQSKEFTNDNLYVQHRDTHIRIRCT